MTREDYLKTAAIFAKPEDVAELARVIWQAWLQGHQAGMNELLFDERVIVKAKDYKAEERQ